MEKNMEHDMKSAVIQGCCGEIDTCFIIHM